MYIGDLRSSGGDVSCGGSLRCVFRGSEEFSGGGVCHGGSLRCVLGI